MTDQVIPVQNEFGQGEEVQALRAQLARMKATVADFHQDWDEQRDRCASFAREADRLRAQRDELLARLRSLEGNGPLCRAAVRSGADPEAGEPCDEPIDPYCPRHRDQPETRHKPGCQGHCGHTQPGWWPACWTDTDLRTGAPQRT